MSVPDPPMPASYSPSPPPPRRRIIQLQVTGHPDGGRDSVYALASDGSVWVQVWKQTGSTFIRVDTSAVDHAP